MSGKRLAMEMHVVATMPCQGTVLNQGGHVGHAGAGFWVIRVHQDVEHPITEHPSVP